MHEDPIAEVIRRYYDQGTEQEWERMERHRTEVAVTMRALAGHLPPPPARVLDCGGGPGRYAIELARRGYDVTLFDLSPACLRLAEKKAAEAGVALAGYVQGTATDLSCFPDEAFDAVLLMGPLYHLLAEEDRRQTLAETWRVLKPGGTLFATFISRYAVLRHVAAHQPTWPLEQTERLEMLMNTGILAPRGQNELKFVAHFAYPTQVGPLCQRAGFEVLTVLGVEGVVSMIEDKVNALSGKAWDTWVNLNYHVAPDPSLHGGVEHLLVVALKPRWRVALRRVARQLDQAGVAYRVVGGTSVVLHGVPIPVKDLDLETDAEGAYRFQALFAGYTLESVALRESETYRSHFGRFDFDGVSVEVMGDLHRREGEGWVSTATTTETTVNLDGVRVRVSWLEEETLAYIRRGRLERAAKCLPHCNQARLLALLRGEEATQVL
jgi:S-adenosylmethionine-dependent methyltransferase